MGLARWQKWKPDRLSGRAWKHIWRSLRTAPAQSGFARARIFLMRKVRFCKVADTEVRMLRKEIDGIALPYAVTLANDSLGNIWLGGGLMVSRWQISSSDTYVPAGLNPARNIQRSASPPRADQMGLFGSGWCMPRKGGAGYSNSRRGAWKPFIAPEFDGSTLEVTALLLGPRQLSLGRKP